MFDASSAAGAGFTGFVPWRSLDPAEIPSSPGVYLVLRDGHRASFVHPGSGGRFKGRDPNVASDVLMAKWVEPSDVVYVGKATSLRTRLRQFRDFGVGKPIGHWGGRYIWQLDRAHDLIVCWKPTDEDPALIETDLLARFVGIHGRLPFANLRH